jgi:hypothetical protein
VPAAAVNDISTDEERRAPAVTLSEVLATCRELEMEGIAVTRRSVRDRLGRGSMTTIHNGVTQYESRREPPAPEIDLTQEDRNVIADLGARALAIAEGRVERVLAEREAALQTQIAAANARADDAIVAAEALVAEAQRHTLEALATSEAARSERDSAVAAAEEDRQIALRLQGKVEILTADKATAEARSVESAAELTAARAELAAEKALRQQRDLEAEQIKEMVARLQAEHAAQTKDSAETIDRCKVALATEQGRLAEIAKQHSLATSMVERLEQELASKLIELQSAGAALAVAEALAATRSESLKQAIASLPVEESRGKQLASILTAVEGQTEALRSLKAHLISKGVGVPTLEQQ